MTRYAGDPRVRPVGPDWIDVFPDPTGPAWTVVPYPGEGWAAVPPSGSEVVDKTAFDAFVGSLPRYVDADTAIAAIIGEPRAARKDPR